MSNKSIISSSFKVNSPNVKYDDENNEIISKYVYKTTIVTEPNQISVVDEALNFKTNTSIPKLGVMLVGWGGNNGTTLTAGILANKLGLKWATKDKEYDANYYGSLTQSSTVKIGYHHETKESVHIPFKYLLPMVEPNDIVVGGWDISSINIGEAMKRAKVIDYDLQKQLYSHLTSFVPLPSIYDDCFIAANQVNRADNVISGTKKEKLTMLRKNIIDFKSSNKLDKVIVLWTANTEKFSAIEEGVNDTAANLMSAIERNEADISPSTLFAVASILEGCSYINGSPSNTFVPGVIELAEVNNIFICGDDFKSGQTKLKSVLVDFLVSAGIKPVAIVSYNHLGNNDGYNLSAPEQFRSKEISKSNVVNDIVNSNRILYREDEHPDHCVVIKYVPYVGDSKRALDEYTSEIFLGGKNTIVIHNTCEDSLLATPIMLDLIILCELCERIKVKRVDEDDNKYVRFHCVLSLLSYLMKAPLVPQGTPVINALFAQRQCIVNVFRACLSLPPDDNMALEYKIPFLISPSKHGLNLVESEIVHLNGTLTSNNSNGIETSNGKSKRQKLIE